MREMTNGAESFHALVVTVAGDTIIFDELLVKRDVLFFFFDSQAFCGDFADLLYLVAVDALCGWAADKRGMAGKTICGKFGMGINGFTRADHQLWREYSQ